MLLPAPIPLLVGQFDVLPGRRQPTDRVAAALLQDVQAMLGHAGPVDQVRGEADVTGNGILQHSFLLQS